MKTPYTRTAEEIGRDCAEHAINAAGTQPIGPDGKILLPKRPQSEDWEYFRDHHETDDVETRRNFREGYKRKMKEHVRDRFGKEAARTWKIE